MYNNFYQPNNYNNYNPYQSRLDALQQPQLQRQEIIKVSGENGAKAYPLPPNSSVLLLDETMPIIWLKTTDGASYPTLTPYTITPYQPEQPIDTKSLEQRIARLEELINEQSNNADAKQKQSNSDK